MKTLLNYFLLLTVLCLTQLNETFSQGFEVAPVIMEFNAEPSSSQTKTLTITNYFNTRRSFNMNLGDFNRNEKGEKSFDKAGKNNFSCANWITVSPSFVEVNPNESKEVKVTMSVPTGENKTKWCMLYVRAAKPQSAFGADKGFSGGMVISPTIGVQIYQSPNSNNNFKAALSDLKEISKSEDGHRRLSVFVENQGEKNLKCKMYLLIANLQTAEETKTPITSFPLLPGGAKIAELNIPKDLASGTYSVAAILDYGKGHDLEGIQTEITVQ